MSKRFQKGTPVYVICDWDRKGTVDVSRWVVGSWGARQGFLTQDGSNFRRRVYTERVISSVDDVQAYEAELIVPVSEVEDVDALAMQVAQRVLAAYREHYASRISEASNPDYELAIRKEIAALHEPRVTHDQRSY